MAKSKSRVEILLEQHATVQNATLKAAMKEVAEREEAAQKKELIEAWEKANHHLNNKLNDLRNIRREEKLLKKQVEASDAAIEQFKKDGDVDKLWMAINKAEAEYLAKSRLD